MARARVFPDALARRNAGSGVPGPAVLLMTGLAVVSVLFGGSVRQYAMTAVMSVMLLQIGSALTLARLPSRLPAEWAGSGFRLGPVGRAVVAVALGLLSAGFFLLGAFDNVRITAGYFAAVAGGVGYYYLRRAALARRGYDMDGVLRSGASAEGIRPPA
jgi:hypothetical protein